MKKENKIRYGMGFLILIVLLILLLFLNINGGSIRLSAREILAVLGRRSSDATAVSILWNIRLPRILAALLLVVSLFLNIDKYEGQIKKDLEQRHKA